MLKLAIVALVCARALALPAAPDTALTPPDLERTSGPKCCECGARDWSEAGCLQQAKVKPKLMWWEKVGKKQTCKITCKPFGGHNGWTMYADCRFPEIHNLPDGYPIRWKAHDIVVNRRYRPSGWRYCS